MKCEMCGGQIDQLMVNIFNHDGSDGYYKYPFQELEENAVEIEVNPNWTGGFERERTNGNHSLPTLRTIPLSA